jgi:hypothetical protein
MNSALSQIAARVASVIPGSGRCTMTTEDMARSAHLDVLATQFALIELEVSGVISMRFVPGVGRVIELATTHRELAACGGYR